MTMPLVTLALRDNITSLQESSRSQQLCPTGCRELSLQDPSLPPSSLVSSLLQNQSSILLFFSFPVSDLEEDLRAASAFLSTKRSSSVFTDSLDDLSSRCVMVIMLMVLFGWRLTKHNYMSWMLSKVATIMTKGSGLSSKSDIRDVYLIHPYLF